MAAYLLRTDLRGIRRHREGDLAVMIQPNQTVRSLGKVQEGMIDVEIDELTFTVVYDELVRCSDLVFDNL